MHAEIFDVDYATGALGDIHDTMRAIPLPESHFCVGDQPWTPTKQKVRLGSGSKGVKMAGNLFLECGRRHT
jgi:hypothetical protein